MILRFYKDFTWENAIERYARTRINVIKGNLVYLSINAMDSLKISDVVLSVTIGCSVISWFLIIMQFQYLTNP